MQYQISGKQIDIGEALQQHVRTDLGSVVEKYAERPTNANVVFSKSAHEYVCEATVHLSTGLTAQAKAHATEIYAAFDACSEKMEKQLRRYKRRLRDHHRPDRSPLPVEVASSFVLAPTPDEDDSGEDLPNGADQTPLTVAEGNAQIRTMTVSEAVMQLELGESPALMFRNARHDGLNMVYRRPDGHIGWVDPANSEKT